MFNIGITGQVQVTSFLEVDTCVITCFLKKEAVAQLVEQG